MKRILAAAAMVLILSVLPLSAEPGRLDTVKNAASLLGMDLAAAFDRFGVPERVSSVRGEEAWQDDVIFIYPDSLSLFWFQDKVWQIRLDKSFPEAMLGLSMGVTREKVVEVFGPPLYAESDWIIYHFAGEGFPVRVRFFFGSSGLEDVYIFRGDF